jgi:hypothetical protein
MSAEQPKKPASSYFLFASEHRGSVAKSLGEAADRKSVAAALSEKWKALDPKLKNNYEEKWRQAKVEYEESMKAWKEAGGVVAPRAARGTGTRRKRGGGPASQNRSATLEGISDQDFLAEMARRLVEPSFASLMAQCLCASDQPGAKRRRADSDGEGRQREASDTPGLGAPVLPTTIEEIAGEVATEPAEQASVKAGEQEGFEKWLEARWDKFKSMADGTSKKKIRAYGLQRWAELSDAKKQKWCTNDDES